MYCIFIDIWTLALPHTHTNTEYTKIIVAPKRYTGIDWQMEFLFKKSTGTVTRTELTSLPVTPPPPLPPLSTTF